jgi:hypothetical protein
MGCHGGLSSRVALFTSYNHVRYKIKPTPATGIGAPPTVPWKQLRSEFMNLATWYYNEVSA